ncbi:MAG: helix-hairpin-helix domain-containing protein [Sulfurovum sp.]|nr:helix-hairpin-helix domain-containing protein [Sulfurovum sp.]
MFKKVITGFLILATSTVFGMSLSELNEASKSELIEIKGIGEAKADAIMKARKFESFDDVLKVKGVGEKLLANIKNDVKSKANSEKPTKK